MSISVKRGGAYASAAAVKVKRNGTYADVIDVFVKRAGAYVSAFGPPITPVDALTTNTATFNGSGSIAIPSNSAWDFANDLWCIAFCFKANGIGGTAINRTLLSNGAGSSGTAPANSANLLLNGSSGTTSPGSLEFRWRDGTNAVRTVTSALPMGDGAYYVGVVQRTAAGRIEMLTAQIMATEVALAQTSVVTMGVLTNSNQIVIGHTFDLLTQRGFNGSMPWIGKGTGFNLTQAEVLQMANGNVRPGDLAGHAAATWDALYYMTSSTGTYVDQSGKGNTATRSASGVGTGTNAGPTFGPRLVISGIVEKQCWQKKFDGSAVPAPVTVTWNGPTGDLQARAIDWYTGADVSAWADVATGVPASVSSVNVNGLVNTDWQVFEVRSKTYPQIVGRTLVKVGVGEGVLIWGQSQYFNKAVFNTGQPAALDLTSRLSVADGSWMQPNGIGLRTNLNYLQTLHNCPVFAIMAAVGGSGLITQDEVGYWDGRGPTDHFTKAMAAVAAVGGSVRYRLWNQGGSDARQNISGAAYKGGLDRLNADSLAFMGRTMAQCPFMMSSIYRIENDFIDLVAVAPKYDTIHKAQQEWLDANAGSIDCGTSVDLAVGPDKQHWIEAGQTEMAQRENQAFAVINSQATNLPLGPSITGAALAGNVLTVTVSHVGGTGLQQIIAGGVINSFDIALAADTAYASKFAVTASSFPTATTIQLTLGSTPSGQVRLRHLAGALPGGNTQPTNVTRVPRDNAPINGANTQGVPVRRTIADILST